MSNFSMATPEILPRFGKSFHIGSFLGWNGWHVHRLGICSNKHLVFFIHLHFGVKIPVLLR